MTDHNADQPGGATDDELPDHPLVAFSEATSTAEAVKVNEEQVTIRVDTDRGPFEFQFRTVGGGRVERSRLVPPSGEPVPLAGDEVPSGIQATLREETPYKPER